MKTKTLTFAAALAALVAVTGTAQADQRSVATYFLSKCESAMLTNTQDVVRSMASSLRRVARESVENPDFDAMMTDIFNTPAALKCMSLAKGREVVFDAETGDYAVVLTAEEIQAAEDARAAEVAEAELEAKAAAGRAERERTKKAAHAEITRKVLKACHDLRERDAYSNPLCVQVFRAEVDAGLL